MSVGSVMGRWSRVVLLGILALGLAQGTASSPPARLPKKLPKKLPKVEEEPAAEAAEPAAEAAEEPKAAAAEAVGEEEAELPEEEAELPEEEAPPPPPIAIDAPAPKTAPAPSPTPSSAAGSKASVQFMITADMKEKLLALGYSDEDIAQLQPERARVIVNRGLKRTSKLPPSWTRSARREGPIVQAWRRLKQHTGTPAGVAGLAAGGLATVLVASLSGRPQPNFALAARPKAVKPINVKVRQAKAPSKMPPPPPPPPSSSSGEQEGLWLDRQIDKVIAWIVRPYLETDRRPHLAPLHPAPLHPAPRPPSVPHVRTRRHRRVWCGGEATDAERTEPKAMCGVCVSLDLSNFVATLHVPSRERHRHSPCVLASVVRGNSQSMLPWYHECAHLHYSASDPVIFKD